MVAGESLEVSPIKALESLIINSADAVNSTHAAQRRRDAGQLPAALLELRYKWKSELDPAVRKICSKAYFKEFGKHRTLNRVCILEKLVEGKMPVKIRAPPERLRINGEWTSNRAEWTVGTRRFLEQRHGDPSNPPEVQKLRVLRFRSTAHMNRMDGMVIPCSDWTTSWNHEPVSPAGHRRERPGAQTRCSNSSPLWAWS